jgi:hypothetical protein
MEIMMKNKTILTIALLSGIFSAQAKKFQLLDTQLPPTDTPRIIHSVWTNNIIIAEKYDSGYLITPFTRLDNGFRQRSGVKHGLQDIYPLAPEGELEHMAFISDPFGTYWLTSRSVCNDTSCTTNDYSITVLTPEGRVDTSRVAGGTVRIETSCVAAPTLLPQSQGVALFDGCGNITSYNPIMVINSEHKVDMSWTSGNIAVHPSATYKWSSPSEPQIALPNQFWVVSIDSNDAVQTYTPKRVEYGMAEGVPFITLSDGAVYSQEGSACSFVPGSEAGYLCKNEEMNGVEFQSQTVEGSFTYTPKLSVLDDFDKKDIKLSAQTVAFYDQEHLFLRASAIQTITADDENNEPQLIRSLQIDNVNILQSSRLSSHSVAGSALMSRWSIDPSGFFAAAHYVENGKVGVAIYDQLNINSAPQLLRGIGGVLPSNIKGFEQAVLVQDEESSLSEIDINFGAMQDWIYLISDNNSNRVGAEPYHDDVGDYNFTLRLTEQSGNEREVPLSFTVELSDYQALVFEPNLFEQVELEVPVSINTLIDAFTRIPVVEDEPYTFSLSFFNRLSEEMAVDVEQLPAWLSWDKETLSFSGTPLQSDVGEYDDFYLLVTDSFEPVNEEIGQIPVRRIAFRLDVIEVDEPLKFTSEPTRDVDVGAIYTYNVTLTDEESELEDIQVSVPVAPKWLNFNTETLTLSGTPSDDDRGDHRVQILVQDEGGFAVVQTFTVSVNSDEPDGDSGGGSVGSILLLPLAMVMFIRRRKVPSNPL